MRTDIIPHNEERPLSKCKCPFYLLLMIYFIDNNITIRSASSRLSLVQYGMSLKVGSCFQHGMSLKD